MCLADTDLREGFHRFSKGFEDVLGAFTNFRGGRWASTVAGSAAEESDRALVSGAFVGLKPCLMMIPYLELPADIGYS